MNEDEKKRDEAEKRAFELVDSQNAAQFGEEEFAEFKELWPLVGEDMRNDLALQLLEKLKFPQKAHNLPKENTGIRTSSLYQDFVMRSILNQTADIGIREFAKFNSVYALVRYLQRTLKNTFLNKLKKFVETLDSVDPDTGEERAIAVPTRPDDSLQIDFGELRKTALALIKNLLAIYDDGQQRYDLLYARAVEGKKFKEIAQEFNERYNVKLTHSAYQHRYAAIVQDLRRSGQLAQLKEDLDQLNDQMDRFGSQFKKPSDPEKSQIEKPSDPEKSQIKKPSDPEK